MDPGEIVQAMKEENIEGNPTDNAMIFAQSQQAVYTRRWRKVQEAFIELEATALEAEALWGQVVKESLAPLYQCSNTLFVTVGLFLSRLQNPLKNYEAAAEPRDRQIIYAAPGEEDNFFSVEITTAVWKLENFLRPHLKI